MSPGLQEEMLDAGLGCVAQTAIVFILLRVQDQAHAGFAHTACAALFLFAQRNESESTVTKALDVVTEATIALSDAVAGPRLIFSLRMLSILLCAVSAYRFASEATFKIWWPIAECLNSTTDGAWALADVLRPELTDDSPFALFCNCVLILSASFLLLDSVNDLRLALLDSTVKDDHQKKML